MGIYHCLRCLRKSKVCTRLEDMAQSFWEPCPTEMAVKCVLATSAGSKSITGTGKYCFVSTCCSRRGGVFLECHVTRSPAGMDHLRLYHGSMSRQPNPIVYNDTLTNKLTQRRSRCRPLAVEAWTETFNSISVWRLPCCSTSHYGLFPYIGPTSGPWSQPVPTTERRSNPLPWCWEHLPSGKTPVSTFTEELCYFKSPLAPRITEPYGEDPVDERWWTPGSSGGGFRVLLSGVQKASSDGVLQGSFLLHLLDVPMVADFLFLYDT